MPEQLRKYNSIEEIERDYEAKINNLDDPLAKADLRVELAQAKIDYRNQEAQDRMIDAWRRLALVEYPGASKFPELVQGNTEEEIRASAKEVQDRVASLSNREGDRSGFDQLRERAQDLYGRGGGAGGTGPGSGVSMAYVPPDRAEERWAMQWAEKFNDAPRDVYGVKMGLVPSDVDRYARYRFVNHIKDRVRFWGQLTRSDFRG